MSPNNLFKKIISLTLAVFVIATLITQPIVQASNPFPAFNELGHDPIDYTNGAPNNGDVTGAIGFNVPIGIAMDTDNHWLFVAEADNNRVLVFNLDSSNVLVDRTADYVLGQEDFETGAAQGATADGMHYPDVIEYDMDNHRLFVSDGLNYRIIVFELAGGITNGMDSSYILGGGNVASQNQTTQVNGMAYDEGSGLLYAADTANHRVLIFDARPNPSAPVTYCGEMTTGIVSYMDASCVLGEPDFTTVNPDAGTANAAYEPDRLLSPIGLFLDEDDDLLYVSSDSIGIRIFDVSTLANGQAAINVLGVPDLATGSYDFLTDTEWGSYSGGTPGVTASTLADPRGMVMDEENDILYVTSTQQHRVVGFDVSTITDGEDAISVIGQADFISGDPSTTQTGFQNPQWTVWDPNFRRLYVVDALNNRVLFFTLISLTTSTVSDGTVGTPYSQSLTTSDNQGTVSFEVVSGSLPDGVTLDGTGLTGTPITAGSYSFTIRAVDTVGTAGDFYSNHQSYSMTVASAGGGTGGGTGGSGGSNDTICSDSLDNDGDGLVDYPDDPGCTDINDDDESNPPPPPTYLCSDGLDNDADGLIDYPADSGCASALDNDEYNAPPSYRCSDGIDNDGDGLIDYPADPGCTALDDNTEFNTSPSVCTDISATNYGASGSCIYPSGGTGGGTTGTTGTGGGTTGTTGGSTSGTTGTGTSGGTGGGTTGTTGGSTSGTTGTGNGSTTDTSSGGSSSCNTAYNSGIGGIGGIIIDQVVTSYNTVGCVLAATYEKLKTVSDIVSTLGIIVAGISSIASILFLNPLSFSEIALLPMRLWSLLMSAFGLKKRSRPWGVVYDSVTKQPLDPVYVILQDLEGKEVASSITDIDGRYGFFVNKGVYKMVPSKPNYFFSSRILSGKTRDELYGDLYFGDYFEVKRDGEVITKNIPMDPLKFDWNEFAKRDRKLMRFYSKWDFVFARIASALFAIGFVVAAIALVSGPTLYNKIIFALYIVMFIFRLFGVSPTKLGSVARAENGDPLSYAVVHLLSPTTGIEVGKKVANKYGKFYFLAPKGEYILKIDQKNKDQSYTSLPETNVVVEKGVLNKNIKV